MLIEDNENSRQYYIVITLTVIDNFIIYIFISRYDYGSLNATREVMQRNIDAGIPLVTFYFIVTGFCITNLFAVGFFYAYIQLKSII